MKRANFVAGLCAALILAPAAAVAQSGSSAAQSNSAAEQDNTNTWSPELAANIVKQIRSKITSLPDYSVFDSLRFAFKGKTVVLKGYASRPTLKSEAEKVVKGIEGVEGVDNEIQVLPPSPNYDRIRWSVYRRIYSQPTLRK